MQLRVVLLTLALAATLREASAEQLTVAVPRLPLQGNVFNTEDAAAYILRSAVFSTLLQSHNGGEDWSLGAAAAAESSADGLTWELRLRSDQRFSSTRNVRASDAGDSLRRCAQAKGVMIAVREQGSERLIVQMEQPGGAGELRDLLQHCPVGESESARLFGERYGRGTFFVGAGTYRITEFQGDNRVILQRVSGAPGAQVIEIKAVSDPDQALAALRMGNLDLTFTVSPEMLERARKDETLQVAECSIFYVVSRVGLTVRCGQTIDITALSYTKRAPKA